LKRISNIEKNIPMRRMVWKIRIPKIVPNVKISHYNENIVEINFSILEILQSQLR